MRRNVEAQGLGYHDTCPWDNSTTLGAALLTPTRIYVRPLLAAVQKDLLKGMAHITGGGLYDNVPRMLPKHLSAEIDVGTWDVPAVFQWLRKAGNVEATEFARTWNTGLGMVCVVAKDKVKEAVKVLEENGETVKVIGSLVKRGTDEGTILRNLEAWA